MKYKVLCTAPFKRFPKVMEHFHMIFDGSVIEYMPYNQIFNIIDKYDGMIPNARIALDKLIIDKASNLKAVYQPSMGYEHIDVDYLNKRTIAFNALGLDTSFKEKLWSTAEHTMSLILALLKDSNKSINNVKNFGKWDNREYQINDLRNLDVGIIGYGNIGKKVAYLCNCFGAKVSAYDPYIEDSVIPNYVKRFQDITPLLQQSDIISLHVPFNEETHDLLGSKEINLMKDNSFLVNTSRGGIVNEPALMIAVSSKKITGLAMDVLDGESPNGVEEQAFAKFAKDYDNILITPHLGGSSYPYMESIFLHSINELNKMLDH